MAEHLHVILIRR